MGLHPAVRGRAPLPHRRGRIPPALDLAGGQRGHADGARGPGPPAEDEGGRHGGQAAAVNQHCAS